MAATYQKCLKNYNKTNITRLGKHLEMCENSKVQCSSYSIKRIEKMEIDDVNTDIEEISEITHTNNPDTSYSLVY